MKQHIQQHLEAHHLFQVCPACDRQQAILLQTPGSPPLVDVVDAVEGLETRAGKCVHDWRQPMLHGCAPMPQQKKLQLLLGTLSSTQH